jgi:hypothetical protein
VVLIALRIVGIFNAALWLGSALFFTFGVAPGIFSPEMKRIFAPPGGPMGDYYLGVIAQHLIGRFFTVNLICGLIALAHFFGEIIYAGRPFNRLTFGLIVGILGLGLVAGTVFSPKIKALHQAKYRGPVEQRAAAAQQLSRLHAVSMSGNLLSLIALILYTWRASNPADPLRFVGAQKFRG